MCRGCLDRFVTAPYQNFYSIKSPRRIAVPEQTVHVSQTAQGAGETRLPLLHPLLNAAEFNLPVKSHITEIAL